MRLALGIFSLDLRSSRSVHDRDTSLCSIILVSVSGKKQQAPIFNWYQRWLEQSLAGFDKLNGGNVMECITHLMVSALMYK